MRFLAVLLISCTPALAVECPYEADDHITAVETADGYAITYGDGTKDYCRDESAGPGTLARLAKCDNGWEGVVAYAGSKLRTSDRGLLILYNTVFYRTCPPTN